MKKLLGLAVFGGLALCLGMCILSMAFSSGRGGGNKDSSSSLPRFDSSIDAEKGKAANKSNSNLVPSANENISEAEKEPGNTSDSNFYPRLTSTIYVDDEVHLEMETIDDQLGFLASQLDSTFVAIKGSEHWVPMKNQIDRFKQGFVDELAFLKPRIEAVTLAEVRDLFLLSEKILEEDVNRLNEKEPRSDLVNKIGTEFFENVKSESSKTLKSVPKSDLVLWTQERLRKFATFPSTVKFGWFPEVIAASNNRQASVIGTFKASNAFGLELKYEYRAVWHVADQSNSTNTWSMISLSIDGETVYVDEKTAIDNLTSMEHAMSLGALWNTRRGQLLELVEKVESESGNIKRWSTESREFVSDKGTKVIARFKESTSRKSESTVILEKSDGTTIDVPLNRLSEDDRKFIASKTRSPAQQDEWDREARVFTSTAGSQLRARFKSATGVGDERIVTLEKEDTLLVKLPVNLLCDDDKAYIEAEIRRRR